MANWKKGFNPSELAKKIEATRKVKKDGSVSFEGWDFKLHDTLLYSMVSLSEEIPEIEGRGVAQKAIFEAGKKGKITQRSLLAEINIQEQNYLNQEIVRFALATSISLYKFSKIDRINVGRTQIIFEIQHPKRFSKESTEIRKKAQSDLFAQPPNNYLDVRVHVSARSHAHAADKALDSLDFIRAVWNLFENRKHSFRWSMRGKPKPVNQIVLGPYHFLHFPTGKLASNSRWWYEPGYLGAVKTHRFSDLTRLNEYTSDIRSRLKRTFYREVIESALIRYTRALDERNWNNAFIRLWGVLELLTDTINVSQVQTISRAAFCYRDYDFNLQILKQLREYRNRSVHADVNNSEIESFLYQLKNVVENLLYFHLGNTYGFKSITEAGNFLSLPRDKEALKLRADMAEYAQRFLGYKK